MRRRDDRRHPTALVEDEDAARVVAVLKNLLAGVDPL
jgi:hypothetical protein